MCTRRRQQAAIEHKGIPGHNGHDSAIAVCLRLSAKVALSDAAEVFAGAIVIEVLNEERLPRLALERHGLAVHHVEPLVRQLDVRGGTRGQGRVVEDALTRLGSDREHDSIALVGARVLRLSDHFRSVRLRELERDLLRSGDATQRDLVRSALIVGDIEIDALVRTVLRDRRPFEVATLVGRRRERRVPTRINGYRSVIDRTVDSLCLHFKPFGLVRVIGLGIVRIGVIRIGLGVRVRLIGIGIIRVGVDGLLLPLHRQRARLDDDVEVRVGNRRANLVRARWRILIGITGVLDLHARGADRALQARGERGVRLPLVALGVIDLYLELRRRDLELADGGTGIAMGS